MRLDKGLTENFHSAPDEPPSGGAERKKIPLLPLTREKIDHKNFSPALYRTAIERILDLRERLDRTKTKQLGSAEQRVGQLIAEEGHRHLHHGLTHRSGFDFELALGKLIEKMSLVPIIRPAPFGSDVVDHFDSAWILPAAKLTLLVDFTEDQGDRLKQKKERFQSLGISTPRGLIETGAISDGVPFVRALVTPPELDQQQSNWYQKFTTYERAVTHQSSDDPEIVYNQFTDADFKSIRKWIFDEIFNQSFAEQRAYAAVHGRSAVLAYLGQAEKALRQYQ